MVIGVIIVRLMISVRSERDEKRKKKWTVVCIPH